jgi:PilZ domain
MSNQERRRSPRKECLVPLRFRILENGDAQADTAVRLTHSGDVPSTHGHFGVAEGQAENVSEKGIYFVSREKVSAGQEVELFFTLPSDLTGRPPESVRCNARVVFVQHLEGNPALTGAGLSVCYFEASQRPRHYSN